MSGQERLTREQVLAMPCHSDWTDRRGPNLWLWLACELPCGRVRAQVLWDDNVEDNSPAVEFFNPTLTLIAAGLSRQLPGILPVWTGGCNDRIDVPLTNSQAAALIAAPAVSVETQCAGVVAKLLYRLAVQNGEVLDDTQNTGIITEVVEW